MRLVLQHLKKDLHGVRHSVAWKRYMHRVADVNGTVAIPCKVRRLNYAGGDPRGEHFTIPGAMVLVGDFARILVFKNRPYAGFHGLKSLPVAAGSESIGMFAVVCVRIRIPV